MDSNDRTWKDSEYLFFPDEHEPVDGVDYFALTYENRSINLDDAIVPAGKVVTGVRFNHRNGHVLLEVRATDFDYEEGRLKNLEKSVWISNENGGKHEYQIPNRFNPFEKNNVGKIYVLQSLKDSYVRFGPTDFKSDLGQVTIPLIEIGIVESYCPTALSGIGLSYKNDEQLTTGGVITAKLITYEFPIGDALFQ